MTRRVLAAALFAAFAVSGLRAQTAGGTGTIVGRVYNPANHQYVENAEIDVQGTALAAVTNPDGSYRLLNVPAGPVTLTLSYTGFRAPPASLTLAAGQTLTQDFNLLPGGAPEGETVVQLQAYNVSATATGNAKMIMQQKESMNVSTMVSADTFGNIPEGNVGEFLKFLPGIDLDYVEAEARNPRIRGLPAQFTTVTFDHMRIASADGFIQYNGTDNGGGSGAGDRSFGFDQVSLGNIEAVQVNYTVNAMMDADGAAGNINLVPRHAFELKGQQIELSMEGMMNSEEAYFARKYGPDDSLNSRVRPNGHLSYANSFFDNRLGLAVDLGEADTYEEQRQFAPTYTVPSATSGDTRPFVLTTLNYKDGPVIDKRPTASATLDFKVNDYLTASLIWQWTGKYHWVGNRNFSVGTNNTANVGGDGISSWTNVPVTALTDTGAFLNKRIFGHTWIPSLEFQKDNWDVNLIGSISQSVNNYAGGESQEFAGNTLGLPGISLTGMTVTATHPADNMYASTIQQTGGLDWGNLANFTSPTAAPTFSYDGRYVREMVDQVELDAKYTTAFKWPTWIQFGPKVTETTFVSQNLTPWQTWTYNGPGGGLGGSWAMFPSRFQFDPGNGAIFHSISGLTPAEADHNTVGYLFKADPQYFVPAGTPSNYYTAFVVNPHYAREQVNAGYLMADTKPCAKVEVQAGVRYEKTVDEVKNIQGLPAAQVVAAGYPVATTGSLAGVATTIPGIQYQYFTLPRAAPSKRYGDWFPSASVKYNLMPNLTALAAFSHTVTRPSFADISGTVGINDESATPSISLPNTNLLPEYSNNYTVNLTKYFEPVGDVGVSVFENDFKNYIQQQQLINAGSQFGFPDYPSASVTTKVNLPGTTTFRGVSLDYRQGLSFLPKPFNGLQVFANYTRIYTKITGVPTAILEAASPYNYGWNPGVAPNVINYGISYSSYWVPNLSLSAHWTDRTPYSPTYNVWEKPATHVDGSLTVRINRFARVFFSVHNIFDVPDYTYLGVPSRVFSSSARGIEYYGTYLYGGVQLVFY